MSWTALLKAIGSLTSLRVSQDLPSTLHYSSLFQEAQAFRFVNVASSCLLKKAEGESISPKRTENFNLIHLNRIDSN